MPISNEPHQILADHAGQPSSSAVRGRLVRWLLRYPLQRVEDMVLALAVSPNTIYRHLTRLVDEGLVEYVTPSLGVKLTCRFYYLSNAGLLAAAEQEHADPLALALHWGAHEKSILGLLPRLPTLVRLQNLVNDLVAQAPTMLAHAGGYRAELTWHWLRDYQHDFLSAGKSWRLSADAALLFGRKASTQGTAGIEYYCALLLLDPGFVGRTDRQLIMQRLESVLRYRASLAQGKSTQLCPPLIVLVQTPRQREVWQQCAAQAAAALHAAPLIGAVASVALQEAPATLQTLPWQQLAAPAACRLRDLFAPLPKEALLPGLLPQHGSEETVSSTSLLKKRHLLQGDFTRRARQLSLAPADTTTNNQEQGRETVALLSLVLSQRHLELLDLLYAHPLLDTKELAILLNLQIDSVSRYLYELRRYLCVEKCDTERGGRWHLAVRGLHLIAASHHCPLSSIAESRKGQLEEMPVQRGVPLLKKSLARTAAIYAFFTALQQRTQVQNTDRTLLWWETGSRCEHHYLNHGVRHVLRPAAAFAMKGKNTHLFAWLEWEESTTSKSNLVARMQAYAHFVKTREWLAAGFQTLPVLYMVVPEQKYLQQWAPLVIEYLADAGLLVRMTTARLLDEHGPLATIWSQIVPAVATADMAKAPLYALLDLGNSAFRSKG
jgi:DNA-binding IclR family transcriptional regulator